MTSALPAPSALEVTGLVYAYKENRAVDGIDLHVPTGSVYGLLGPNGAGKTTAIRAITTLLPIPAGMVRVFGRDFCLDAAAAAGEGLRARAEGEGLTPTFQIP